MKTIQIRCPNCGELWELEDLCSPTDRAKWWSIKDPSGKCYGFMDLIDFVKNHRSLFNEVDLIVKKKNGKWEACNAYFGLASLRPDKKNTKPSWKGWTWNYV